MATEIEIAEAVTRAISKGNSTLSLKDIGILIGALGGPLVAIFTLYFSNKNQERESKRFSKLDEGSLAREKSLLSLKEDESKRENEIHEVKMSEMRNDIEAERLRIIREAKNEIQEVKDKLRRHLNKIKRDYTEGSVSLDYIIKKYRNRSPEQAITENEITTLMDGIDALHIMIEDSIDEIPNFDIIINNKLM